MQGVNKMAKKESYEEMLTKLQDILNNLETDGLNLEDSMKSYEDGVKLVNKIYKILDSYEAKISIIKDDKEVEFSESNGDK